MPRQKVSAWDTLGPVSDACPTSEKVAWPDSSKSLLCAIVSIARASLDRPPIPPHNGANRSPPYGAENGIDLLILC